MTSEHEKKNILIVEDEKEMRDIYTIMLEEHKEDYDIEYEADASNALEKTKKQRYDLIILDIVMNPMPGDYMYFFMRQNDTNKNTPVIVVSVLGQELMANMKGLGKCSILKKPITKEQLLLSIENALN